MSLTDPNFIDKAWAILKMKPVYVGLGLLAVLIFVWFGITKCESWQSQRDIDKLKQQVNASMANLANAQSNLNVDKQDEAARIEDVKIATNSYLSAVNATDQARQQTNQAIANLAQAVTANTPVGVTAEALHKQLDDLDREKP